jgi:hypothetical protein
MFAARRRSRTNGGNGEINTSTDATIRIGKTNPVEVAQPERVDPEIADGIHASERTAFRAACRKFSWKSKK